VRLVASLGTRNELERYLRPCIDSLLTFCDEVRVQDDGSVDGTYEWLCSQAGVVVKRNEGVSWRENEGACRQALLEFTLEARPTHVLSIDADELVPEGVRFRRALERAPRDALAFSLCMREVWRLGSPALVRTDGGWRPHSVAIAFRADGDRCRAHANEWRIVPRKLAAPRVPRIIGSAARRGRVFDTRCDVLHLGWARPGERAERHRRYVELDGGAYHAKAHLDSIMLPDPAIGLEPYDCPVPLPV
jgi:glycosyltransferase involved in cell wall biosynthesis